MAEAPTKTIINVQYNIPRFVIASPGKQNRACTGDMRIIPGVSNPLEFQYVNTDGVPINLNHFILRLVFWFPQNQYETLAANRQSNVVLAKDLHIDDAYAGKATALLTDQETLTIARFGRSSVRWSIYLIDEFDSSNVFAAQITSNGDPWGMAQLYQTDMPSAEMVKGVSVSRVGPPTSFISLGGVTAVSQQGAIVAST